MTNYIAIIGDLIESKKIKNREVFQENLITTLDKINKKYEDSIVSNITLTIGDEFQGILKVDGNINKIIDELYIRINHDFRLGIGLGEINTKINKRISLGADGEAYWRAREAILYIHNNNYSKRCNIYFIGKDKNRNKTINTLYLLTETIKYQWTNLQRETFTKMMDYGIYISNFNQMEFSKNIGISESSLSKRLTLGNIKIYLEGRIEINRLLEELK